MPDYIGAATPVQVVKIRQGRFTRYSTDNPGFAGPRTNPSGAGHQHWNEGEYPCGARVGSNEGPHANLNWNYPWQALWLPDPARPYVDIPNVLSVKQDKKKDIGGVGTATIEIDNITYPVQAGGFHQRERGTMSPLRGYTAPGKEPVKGEWGEVIPTNEWSGRFAYVSQVTIYQGYGTSLAKTFTGLVEEVDITSHPDKIILTVRDFGQIFTEEHFFDWAIDPLIKKKVVFTDEEEANTKKKVGYNAHSSDEDTPEHPASKVLRTDPAIAPDASWQTNTVHSAEQTEYVEIALPEGAYSFADIHVQWGGMEAYFSLRAANKASGLAPYRVLASGGAEGVPMTKANKWLDKNGWVDLTKAEGQIVPGVNGGVSYMRVYESYPSGPQRTPLDPAYPATESSPVTYHVGPNSVLRISFRKLHKVEAGENFRAGVQEMHGLVELLEEAGSLPGTEWVTVKDVSDIVRIICQWAGFKEWDIQDTGSKLVHRIITDPTKAYADIIKQVAEGVGFEFFMADPSPDGSPVDSLGGSLGIPTFRKSQVVLTAEEKAIMEAEYAAKTVSNWSGRKVQRDPLPVITDRSLLTNVNLKENNEPLAYTIRVFGKTQSQPGSKASGGVRLEYTFRPPWAGDPTIKYADSRLAGLLKLTIHTDPLFSTPELVRNAAWEIALQEALASIEATIEFPAFPGLDLDDHAVLLDLGTGVSTRMAVWGRSSTFTDGEKRKWSMQLTGPLIDVPDIIDMLAIIHGTKVANGEGGEWASPNLGTGSTLGYG